jgi:hypothetical protein
MTYIHHHPRHAAHVVIALLSIISSLLIILLEVWSVARKYAFNPSKIRFHPETSSLLIILLEVWSVARKYAFNPPKIRFYPETSNYPSLPSVSKKRFSQRCAAAPPQSIFSFILPDPAAHRPRMWLRPLVGKRLSRAPPGARLHLLARSIPCPSVFG